MPATEHTVGSRLTRLGRPAWSLVGIGVLVIGTVWVMLRMVVVLLPVVVGLLLAALMLPVVDWLARRRVPRLAGTWLVLLVVLAGLAGVVWLVVPAVTTDASQLGTSISDGFTKVEDWLVTGPLGLSRSRVDTWANDLRAEAGSISSTVAKGALARTPLALELVAGGVLSVVLAFFFTKDGPPIAQRLMQRVDPQISAGLSGSWLALVGYARALIVNATVNAAVIGVAVALLGVPLAGPIAALTFLLSFVPIVGALVAGTIATLVALVSAGPATALAVVAVTIGVHHLEGYVVGPLVVRHHTGSHPVLLMLALVAGIKLGGVAGGFLAGPVTVAIVGAVRVARGEGGDPYADVPLVD